MADLLLGDAALLDAAKKGNLARLQRLLTADNINCRDSQGRNSTPLHLAGQSGGVQRGRGLTDAERFSWDAVVAGDFW